MTVFLSFFTIVFWLTHVIQRVFYILYILQLKEYRIDRFFEEASRNRKVIFPGVAVIAFFLFIIFEAGLWDDYFIFILAAAYFLFGLRALHLLFRKRLKKPKLTKKMMLIIGFFFVFLAAASCLFLDDFLFFILGCEILLPIFILLCVQLVQIPTFFIKQYIFWRAKKKREGFGNLLVIGISGSFGKSSTKEFLAEILAEKFNVLKTEGNINTELGVANTILKDLKKEHQVFVCEMAAYRRGEIRNICRFAKPKIGILTGINQQHLALFGSQENIIKAKYELIESLPGDGIAFFNAKNKYCRELYEKTLRLGSGQAKIKSFLYGQEAELTGTENFSGAVAVARELGMSESEINKASEDIQNKTGGFQLKKGINGLKIIDASYSANPDGVMMHLEYLKSFPGKKIIVMPCLIELGRASKEVHGQIGKRIAEVCDLAIITTRDNFENIVAGSKLSEIGYRSTEIVFMEGAKEIFEKIKGFVNPSAGGGDTVLLESRAPDQLIKLLEL